MIRNQQTTAGKLKTGDRFYKASDKRKRSLQIVDGEAYSTQHRTYKMFCCPSEVMDNHRVNERLKRSQYSPIMSNTEVIYLRSVTDI